MTKTVLILGASGKIGRHCMQAFRKAGWTVRAYDRKTGDMLSAARGADVIVNGLNPPAYHDWANLVPAITRQVIEAAKASGATVILPGNVYNLDAVGGEWSEHTPHAPASKKGAIRERMEQAYRDSGVQTIVLRAGNFIDPERNGDLFSVLLLRAIDAAKVTAAGNPDVEQAYCYVPDWARAAVQLAELRQRLARFEDVPFAGHTFTLNELRALLSERLEKPLRLTRFPWWAMTLTAPFWELAREMREMRYLFDLPHRLNGDKLKRLLPDFEVTPLRTVLDACLPGTLEPSARPAHSPQ